MADIERMRAALVAAREIIEGDIFDYTHWGLDAEHFKVVLAQIDAALAQEAQR